ncbi:hypothetical protein LguiA_027164 [Lonicera macranthoides]
MSGHVDHEVGPNGTDITSSSSHNNTENLPYVHKVGVPLKQNLLKEFIATLKETFLAVDPMRRLKDQTLSRKLLLLCQNIFPILEWGREYNFSKFRGDFIAGLTIASLCIPQDIAYAKLAHLDPQFGLYSSFVPPLIYAVMGSSRDMAIGPVAVVSLLLATLLGDKIDPVKKKAEYQRLTFTATFFAGITQFTLGVFRLGFLIDFLSHAAIVGFMAGAAITIAIQQLKRLLGIKQILKKTDIVSVMKLVTSSAHHGWNWQTILIGVSFLALLLFTKYIGKKNKKLFWVPAVAPLISVIISTLLVFITHADKHGVKIVDEIKQGINPSSIHEIYFEDRANLVKGFRIGVVVGMIALTEAVAIGRTFAAMKDYQLDGNKEMVALGTMNIVGSMTSCYVATGSFSRTAVNYRSGCNTAVSNIVMSFVVLLTLKVITPLFHYTPDVILASIIISAVIGFIDFNAMIFIWKIDKFDFVACMGAFFGVVFISVEIGLLIAVCISFAKIILQVTRPRTAVLGKIPRTGVYRNTQHFPEASKDPGVLIVRVESAIYFSNSNYVKEKILRWLTDEEEQLKQNNQPKIQFLIVEMSSVSDIDTSGIHALEELYRSLHKKDIQLALANPGQGVIDKLHASESPNLVGEDKIFLTVADAVLTCSPRLERA